ncbi:DUF4198 domain-containing protein [Alteromonas sp. C1M14]|uniref:DUF4198 domain-containing protein n=1 Tax=Alteromonas sp. C1M14 TaxID=2841567 RepID=UPI001C09D54D|nr:DUF4198 domain-containing protein [Alteromonas sp. C1M14]MBU2978171.1 DUF4198 domain-containing protein [Alteromonas sp. C1M14]
MKFRSLISTGVVALSLIATPALAHRAWIKPTTTVVSGDDEWISFDAAVANGIFTPDHFPLSLDSITVLSPSGEDVTKHHGQKLRYRSVFDINLKEEGTYRVFTASRSIMAFWKDENGKRKRWPGRGETASVDEFDEAVPKDADDLQVIDSARRIDVFVTAKAPSDTVLKPTGNGLELNGETHPNDLYTGEAISLGFLMDGEAASSTKVTIVKEGEKYRDTDDAMTLTADENGEISVSFDEPGMYWLEAEYEDDKAKAPAQQRRGMYVLVMEVLPL